MDDGKVAIVTGAGSGVGEQVVVQLSERGYRCVLVGRTLEKLERTGEKLPSEWIAVAGDIGVDGDRARIVEQAMAKFGRVDALVNNAGAAVFCKMGEMSSEQMEGMFAVNSIGPVDLARRVVGQMSDRGSGVIVNVSSMAQVDPFDGLGVYGCTKGAVGVLAKAVANEYGTLSNGGGVRGYSLCPGAIETGMLRSFVSEEMLPSEATLTAREVAERVVGLVTGEFGAENGAVIEMPSP